LELGINTAVFGPERLCTAHLECLARLSIRHIEITAFRPEGRHFPLDDDRLVDEVAAEARRLGILVHSLHAANIDIASPDPEERSRGVRLAEKGIDALERLGGKFLVQHPTSGLPKRISREERLKYASSSLTEIADYAEAHGVVLAVENMLPVQGFSRSEELLRLLEVVGGRNVGICFDTSHAQLSGEGMGMARTLGERIVTIHASDNDGRRDDHLIPGTGIINWEEFVGVLGEIGYDSVFMVELRYFPPEKVLAWTVRKTRGWVSDGRN